jgi:outer membrane biosynthesis protein TonB
MTLRFPLLAGLAIAIAACASAPRTSRATACALTTTDSVYLKRGAVYRDCGVDQRVQPLDHSARPDFHPDVSRSFREACYTATIQFVVDETGIPEIEDARIVHSNSPAFTDAALRAIAQWRYRPALLNGVAVRQITTEKLGISAVVVTAPAGETPRPPVRPPVC